MNYELHYNLLISKRKQNKLSKQQCCCERHHIIPKSLGGSNQSINLVNLSLREHFIAHHLLEKITYIKYGKNSKEHKVMLQALWFMMHDKKYPHIRLTSKSYASIREKYSKSISGNNNRQHMNRGKNSKLYGRKQSDKSKLLNSKSHIGRKHMHNPQTDQAIFIQSNEIDMYLKQGYIIGMSKHEKDSISKRNLKRKHMFNPQINQQVYAQPNDIQKYLDLGFVFGINPITCSKHNEKLKGRLLFYDKTTHKKFYVEKDEAQNAIENGHIPSKSAKLKLKFNNVFE